MLKSIWAQQLPLSNWGSTGKRSCLKQANPASPPCPFKETGPCQSACVLHALFDHWASHTAALIDHNPVNIATVELQLLLYINSATGTPKFLRLSFLNATNQRFFTRKMLIHTCKETISNDLVLVDSIIRAIIRCQYRSRYMRVQGNPNGLCSVDIYQTSMKNS